MDTLIVEDNADLRVLLSDAFEDAGFEVCVAATGEAALQQVTIEAPSILILDLRLPGISGLDLLKYIRAQFPAVVIIVVTADYRAEEDETAQLADFFIQKPFDLHQLITLAKRLKGAEN